MPALDLPTADRRMECHEMGAPLDLPPPGAKGFTRIAYAAAHVVADPFGAGDPTTSPAIDWDATMAFRHRLWDLGLGVAEAMDTAQRGMGLGWPEARELVTRALAEARGREGALIACGAGTDHLSPGPDVTLNDVIGAYEEQLGFVEGEGGRAILMASRALVGAATGPDDYLDVYGRVLSQARTPMILHWLGEMFDPALAGYWGTADLDAAADTCLAMIEANADRIDGIKISLLSKEREIAMRRRLPAGVRMYTGDDFDYAELIAGDAEGHSDALLGIFDAIAPAASAALTALGDGDRARYDAILAPTIPLSRHLFAPPTRFYKTGVVFLAWLNGLQDHFVMVGGQQGARSALHLAEAFRLADRAGVLADPDLAADRMRRLLALHGMA